MTFSKFSKAKIALVALVMALGMGNAWAQNYYVFYNATYGYLYNNNGTLAASANFGPTSVWIAGGTLGTTGYTITPANNTALYLRTSANNNGTVSLNANSTNWQYRNNALCTRGGGTNYYLKATSATAFTTSSANGGNRFTAYTATVTEHDAVAAAELTISGDQIITTDGSYTYSHSTASTGAAAYTSYAFNSNTYYFDDDGQSLSAAPANNNYSNYTWSVNSNSYATINASTGVLTVTSVPTSQTELTITCTATRTGSPDVVSTYTVYLSGSGNVSIGGMYVITNGTYYMAGNSATTRRGTFAPNQSLWFKTSDNYWTNSAGYHLYTYNPFAVSATDQNQWVLTDSENGTNGYGLKRSNANQWVRYYNNAWAVTATQNQRGRIVFSVTKNIYAPQESAPTISGPSQIDVVSTSAGTYSHSDASYIRSYVDYVFYAGAHHYFETDTVTAIANAPTSDNFTYTWSLEGIASTYATINATTGVISYTTPVLADQPATVKLTATSANKTFTITQPVTFKRPADPTAITITSASPMSLNTFETAAIAYTLSPANCYDNVTFTSANPSIATVDANGLVRAISEGSTTITITAKKVDGTTAATATVNVSVAPGDMYVIYNSGYSRYLGGSSNTAITDFDPATCLWTSISGGKWVNSAGYYLGTDPVVTNNASNAATLTVSGTESGTTGRILYNNTNYLSYSNSNTNWIWRNQYNQNTALFAVTLSSYPAQSNGPTISGDNVISTLGSNSSFTRVLDAAHHGAYLDYVFYDGTHHYFETDNATPIASSPAANFTYAWSLEGISSTYATIDASTGVITYNSYVPADQNATVKLTATSTNPSLSFTASQQVTFKAPADPTSITITSDNPMTIYVGETGNIAYELLPANCYDHVTFTSTSTAIATVDAGGTVTGVAPGQTSISVLAYKYFNPSQFLGQSVTVNVRDVVNKPTITFDQNTLMATLACTTPNAAIYYTVNGSDPTTSSTLYTGPFALNYNDEVRAIAVMPSSQPNYSYYDNSQVAISTFIECQLATPVISVTSGGVSFSCTDPDVEIHYTTDGSNPTASSPVWNGSLLTSIANGATIKAMATRSDCGNSNVATATNVTSGISGGVVTLYDLEDHSWTVYQPTINGAANPIYLPEPKDVTITYNGNGGAVGINEPETTFVYYKTLAKENGAYHYTTIPNPFCKRPRSGGNYQGFNRWHVTAITGGTITNANSQAVNVGDYVAAEEQLTFSPTSEYGMEVAFEVEWARAYVVTCAVGDVNSNLNSSTLQGGSYERNFIVITSGTNSSTSLTAATSVPVTITMVTPDGATDYRTGTRYISPQTVTLSNDWKFEYINMRNYTANGGNTTINATNHYLIMGRGVAHTTAGNVCANYIRGLHENVTNLNTKMRIESGVFNYFSAIRGYNGSQETPSISGTMTTTGVLGCDYDRAAKNNELLKIQQQVKMGYIQNPTISNVNLTRTTFVYTVKSGDLCSAQAVNIANADESFYISLAAAYANVGRRELYIEGGQLQSVAGGIDRDNSADLDAVYVRMTGGKLRGSMYGAAAFADTKGNREFIITGGVINGWVAGGCNGTDDRTDGGVLPSTTRVYVGGTAEVGNKGGTAPHVNYSDGGNVFGAGSGNSNRPGTGEVYYSNVVIADHSYIQNDVYGGGNYGFTSNTANVYIMGGQVDGMVFGGANQKQGNNANIYMEDGLVKGGIYGGSNITGVLSGSINIEVDGGQVGTSGVTELNGNRVGIFGGGLGDPTVISQNVDITLGKTGQAAGTGVTVFGDVYGGSALGRTNGTAATTTYHTNVTLNAGTINGSLYGGALGSSTVAANVYGPVAVNVYGGSVHKTDADGSNGSGGVYGANNVNGAPQGSVTVDIYGTDPAENEGDYALYAVYGGGNHANYTYGNGYPKVTVHNCDNSIEYVYGGGNAAAVSATDVIIYGGNVIGNVFGGGNGTVTPANVNGNVSTRIYGGKILNVYGGSNSQGNIGGTITVLADQQAETGHSLCPINVGKLYGGGNMAPSNAGNITIGCCDLIGEVYGGANNANITGNIVLNITGGQITNVFGGNNNGGNVNGQITVNIDWSGSCLSSLENVYGAGNLATYSYNGNYPMVNFKNGHATGNVFGGGKGLSGDAVKGAVTGNPQVTIGVPDAAKRAVIDGSIFGGGDNAPVTGNTAVKVLYNSRVGGDVFGGGNQGDVTGSTNVQIGQ